MKYRLTTSAVNGRYRAQLDVYAFTQHETELIAAVGEPVIELGGEFEGTHSRPGQTNTAIVTTPSGGATLVPVINEQGTITGITVSAGGTFNAGAPALSATGVGTGFAATPTMSGTAIASIAVSNGGHSWQKTPVTVEFELPSRLANLYSGFPCSQAFDLNDYADADIRMKTWHETVIARIADAHAILMRRSLTFQGETVVTL